MLTIGRLVGEIRPILTEDQLREIGEMMEEARVSSEIRFADFAGKLEAGELLGLKNAPVPRGKQDAGDRDHTNEGLRWPTTK